MSVRGTLIALAILSFVLYAIVMTEIGPALPEIRSELKISDTIIGLIASFQSLAGIFSILGGTLSDNFGKLRILIISLWIIGLGTLIISYSMNAYLLALSFFVIGLGGAFFEASVNVYISDIFYDKRGMAINILHIGWSIGSTIGPLLMTFSILTLTNWKIGYAVLSPFLGILPIIIWVFNRKTSITVTRREKNDNIHKVEKINIIFKAIPLLFLSFLYMSCSMGISTWLPSILLDEGGSLIETGLTVSLFWALVGIGRLIWAPFVDKFGYWRVITIGGCGSAFLMTLAILPIPVYIKMILMVTSGFLIAPTYPTIIAWVTANYPEIGGTLSGAVYTFATLGSFSSIILIGFIFSNLGSYIAQLIFPLTMGLVAIITYLYHNISTRGG